MRHHFWGVFAFDVAHLRIFNNGVHQLCRRQSPFWSFPEVGQPSDALVCLSLGLSLILGTADDPDAPEERTGASSALTSV